MLTVTNGSVSRTFKPDDYGSRVVSLSFNVDPGDDLESGIANLAALCEKHARQMPGVSKVNPVQGDKYIKADPAPVTDVATETAAGEPSAEIITDADLTKACQVTTARMKDPGPTKEVIGRFVEKPGMRAASIPMEKRAEFVRALEALKPADADAY